MSFTVQTLQSYTRKQLAYEGLRGLSNRKDRVTHPMPDGEAAVDLHIWTQRVHLFPDQEIFCSH